MPLLIDEDGLVALMSGVGTLVDPQIFENAVYVKARDWRYEKEWRLIGGQDKRKTFEDFGFNARELTGVYFGCRIVGADGDEIRKLVTASYPAAKIYAGKKSERTFAVEFTEVG